MSAPRFQHAEGSALEIAAALDVPVHHLHVHLPASGASPVLTVPASDRRRVVATWRPLHGVYAVAVEEADDDGAWTRGASEDVAAEDLTATVVRLATEPTARPATVTVEVTLVVAEYQGRDGAPLLRGTRVGVPEALWDGRHDVVPAYPLPSTGEGLLATDGTKLWLFRSDLVAVPATAARPAGEQT